MKPERNDCRKLLFLLHERVLHHDFDTAEEIMEAVTSWALLGGEIPIKVHNTLFLYFPKIQIFIKNYLDDERSDVARYRSEGSIT